MTDPYEPDLPALDEPPRSGEFIDHDAAPPTADDVALGQALGAAIDVDDDDDRDGGLL